MKGIFSFVLCFFLLSSTPLWAKSYPVTASLPKNLKWTTYQGEYFGDPQAKKGGTYNAAISSYPLTFRLYGPNSASGSFVGYNRRTAMWGLTRFDPISLETIPWLATHWAIQPDQKTVYYKLDPDARWSDGHKLTADDYLFAMEFYASKHIQAPYYNQMVEQDFESVEKVDEYTIKVVGKKKSWRILSDLDISPIPAHHVELDEDWTKKYNWKPNLTPGPYLLKKWEKGRSLTFLRDKKWWGKDKPRFKSLYNFDKIKLKVVRNDDVEFELFKKGKLDFMSVSDYNRWFKQTDTEEFKKGYILKQKIYIDSPAGIRGIFYNLQDPILKEREVRQALQRCFDFKTINEKFLFGEEVRQHHFFDTFAPYKKPRHKTRSFNIALANRLLDQAGWTGPRTPEGYRTKGGRTLKIVVSTGGEAWIKYLSFLKESAKKAGIELFIKTLDGAALYKSFHERSYQSLVLVYGVGRYPAPRQYLHSENVKKGTNNLFQFSDPEVDRLIEVFENDTSEKKRVKAIHKIEEILKKEAIMLRFWRNDHIKALWWRYLKGPRGFAPKTPLSSSYGLWEALWIDPTEQERLEEAMDDGKPLSTLPLESDPYNLKK